MELRTKCMEVLSEPELKQIWEAALRIWPKLPLRVTGTEEFNQALLDFGCTVDNGLVWFPDSVRDQVLSRIDERRLQNGPWTAAEICGEPVSRVTNGQAFFCCDLESDQVRPASTQDLVDWSWVCDCYPDMIRAHPTFIPQDVPVGVVDIHTFATIILNASRPCRVSVFDVDMFPYFVRLQAICDGSEDEVRENPIFNTTCYANSPCTISHEAIEIGMRARAELRKPLVISSMPVVGSATPVTLAGSLAQSTAECLTMNAVTLALDNRLNGWMETATLTDMKTGMAMVSGPDLLLARLAYAQMSAYVFGGTYRGSGSLNTTAKTPGAQAAIEKSLDAMWGLCAGIRSFSSLGILATSDVASLTQFTIDLEIVDYLRRLAEGVTVDNDRIAEDLITEVAPRGAHYLSEMHTAEHFRSELWTPELIDRQSAMSWIHKPVDMLDNARNKARQVLQQAENQCPLYDDQKREVHDIVTEATARAAEKAA
jgi:trimethylamine---corrinoid protein Co-methyltransferase